jgi:seryl-tRNA synthetase
LLRLKERMAGLEEQERFAAEKLNDILSALPNMVADDVPDGADENDNVEIRTHGTPKKANAEVPDHVAIGEALGMMDFRSSSQSCGHAFCRQ